MNFKQFAQLVHNQFNHMANNYPLFRMNIDRDEIKEHYLNAFPEGTNPTYITNTKHDCSCCKNFIRNVGNLVAVKDGNFISVWDIIVDDEYQAVADSMSAYVKTKPIHSVFYASEKKYGAYESKQTLPDGSVINWNHFHCEMPSSLFKGPSVGEITGQATTSATMLTTAIESFKLSALNDVIELIESNSLYRGDEHLKAVKQFKDLFNKSLSYSGTKRLFGFENYNNPAARFKNTVIGTLVEDLSNGVDLVSAVKSFEAKVAPQNYKRSKSLITQGMINKAMETITELDLEPSLARRHATIHDVNVNDVLFSDTAVQSLMKGGVADLLKQEVKVKKPTTDNAQDISIEDFLAHQLPNAQSIEALVDNKHQSNFMNIIAPINESKHLLKWDNNFTWSYNGNVTDSMKQLVQSFGGKVDGATRCSIMWNEDNDNPDDLDLYCKSPYGHIKYSNKGNAAFNLDVDITSPGSKVAVENIVHAHGKVKQGIYEYAVNNFSARGATSGFKAEIEFNGEVFEYSYHKPLSDKENVRIATLVVDSSGNITITHHLTHSQSSKTIYGVKTQQFVKVNNIMLSPNHWQDNSTGNKHYMFILDGCKTTDQVRGFYNEFLAANLNEHRKVFEVLASKMKVEAANEQLAGLGFSSTVNNEVVLKVTNPNSTKLYNVQF
jgi:hypothetical protein